MPSVNTDATMALVLGVAALLVMPVLLSIPAIVLGRRGRSRARALPGRPGMTMAGWGLGLGVFTLLWPLLVVLLFVVAVASGAAVQPGATGR